MLLDKTLQLKLDNFIIAYAKEHFNKTLYSYQINIISKLLNPDIKKITIRATTRAGKSYSLGIGAIMFATLFDNLKVGIIAPTYPKTRIIMDYVAELLSISDLETIIDLDMMGVPKLERLKKEVSKHKITFKNGSYIEILSADVAGGGFGVMGKAYDLQIVDEVCEIPTEVYTKIYRMLVDNPSAKIIEIGNPWERNHFYDHSIDPTWDATHINWQMCVTEGRITQEAIDDQRKNTTPIEFRVLYDAEFPEDTENTLIMSDWLKNAQRVIPELKITPIYIIGVDCARYGEDYTVLSLIAKYDGLFVLQDIISYHGKDTQYTTGKIIEICKKYKIGYINIDDTGLGGGVTDAVKAYYEQQYMCNGVDYYPEIIPIKVSEKATDSPNNENRKSDIFMNLRKLFEFGNIIIPQNNDLIKQLSKFQYEITGSGKIRILENQDKSPDYADSLAYGCYCKFMKVIMDVG